MNMSMSQPSRWNVFMESLGVTDVTHPLPLDSLLECLGSREARCPCASDVSCVNVSCPYITNFYSPKIGYLEGLKAVQTRQTGLWQALLYSPILSALLKIVRSHS